MSLPTKLGLSRAAVPRGPSSALAAFPRRPEAPPRDIESLLDDFLAMDRRAVRRGEAALPALPRSRTRQWREN